MEEQTYLEASQAAGKAFYLRQMQGPVTMLNLLRYRKVADYSGQGDLAPPEPISGQAAYQAYIDHTLPFLDEIGSEVLFFGKGGPWLIGPDAAQWDAVLLVKHPSIAAFLAFAQNEAYLRGAGHRRAALLDSRLLPIEQYPIR
ncbi:MAG: DUF1330 domain-containing protein [Saprospiraceae bacterium]|nr:DUF1330 domain-containing protein [Saprospiraceae bacterium]